MLSFLSTTPLLLFLLTALTTPTSATAAASPSTLTIYHEFLSSKSASPLPLAHISLTPTPTLTSYTPPKPLSSSPLLRLSVIPGHFSTLVSQAALHQPGTFRVLLSPVDNSTISVSYQTLGEDGDGVVDRSGDKAAWPGVQIVYPDAAPWPALNRPVVLNEEGKVPEKEPEKSLLQK